MDAKVAIIAYAQSEKIKAGLIWLNTLLETCRKSSDCAPADQDIALLKHLFEMIRGEVHLAMRLNPDKLWLDVDRHMHTAGVMIASGVPYDSTYHLTRALTCVTSIGQRALTLLTTGGFF
jgi:hypothetical protein